MNGLLLLGLATVVVIASRKKEQPAAKQIAVNEPTPSTDKVETYKDLAEVLAPVAETTPKVEPIAEEPVYTRPVIPPTVEPKPVPPPVKFNLYYGPYADKYDLDVLLNYLADAYLDKSGGYVDDTYFKRQPPSNHADDDIKRIKNDILVLQNRAVDEILSDNVKAGYPLKGLAEYLTKADAAEVSRLRSIAKTYYGKLNDLYTAIAQGQPLWPIFGRISFARSSMEWNREAVRSEYYANLIDGYLASKTVITPIEYVPSSDAPFISILPGVQQEQPLKEPVIQPITLPSATGINLPGAPPLLSSFPAPTSTYPMPMLLWDSQKVAWVPQGSRSSVTGTATILDAMSGRNVKVDAAFPYLAYIENGVVKMSPNQVYEISNITRLPGGLVVY